MEGFTGDDVWRSIPPEEKFEIMAQAQAAGVIASVITIIISSTIAIGLKLEWLMWASLLASPFIFQFAAGKKWRDVRPRIMLEYLAARAAARRFAFASRGQDLTCKFLFRARVEQIFKEDAVQEALEAMLQNTRETAVWVALFGDSVVMMEEKIGGAEARFAQLLDDKLEFEAHSLDGKGDYSNHKELLFRTTRNKDLRTYKLTSRYPAALVVFERKLQALLNPATKVETPLALNNKFDDDRDSGVMIFD